MTALDPRTVTDVTDDATTADDRAMLAIIVAVLVLACALVGAIVLRTSQAAFTAVATNADNSIRASSVTLDAGVASSLLDVAGMVPGDVEEQCIEVVYEGSLDDPSAVRLYVAGMADPAGLADHLSVTVVEGTADSGCAGATGVVVASAPLATLAARHHDHASGVGTWVPEGPSDVRRYGVTVELDLDTPPELAGTRVDALHLVWEVTS